MIQLAVARTREDLRLQSRKMIASPTKRYIDKIVKIPSFHTSVPRSWFTDFDRSDESNSVILRRSRVELGSWRILKERARVVSVGWLVKKKYRWYG